MFRIHFIFLIAVRTVFWGLLLTSSQAEPNAAQRGTITSIEEVFKSAPASALRKLRDAQDAREIGKYFGQNIVGRQAVLRATVDFAAPIPENKQFRIRATNEPVKWTGGEMPRLVWFYFPPENVPTSRVAVGSEIEISGEVRRCEIVTVNGALRINFDLWKAKLGKP